MLSEIRKMTADDKSEVIQMMREFYSSPAVITNGSDRIFNADIDECTGASQYAEGFVFICSNKTAGYAMIAKSYSTEFGKRCIWLEDIYIKPEYRHKGLCTLYISEIKRLYPNCIIRLEVEKYNRSAVEAYVKSGFEFIQYDEMIIKQCCNAADKAL